MSRIIRSDDLSISGLVEQDLNERQLGVAGLNQNELLPPYQSDNHFLRAQKILSYLEGKDYFACDYYENFLPNLRSKVIEVAGGLANFCIPAAVEKITRNGRLAIVNPEFVLAVPEGMQTFNTGRIVLQQVFLYSPAMCQIRRGSFIFYNP